MAAAVASGMNVVATPSSAVTPARVNAQTAPRRSALPSDVFSAIACHTESTCAAPNPRRERKLRGEVRSVDLQAFRLVRVLSEADVVQDAGEEEELGVVVALRHQTAVGPDQACVEIAADAVVGDRGSLGPAHELYHLLRSAHLLWMGLPRVCSAGRGDLTSSGSTWPSKAAVPSSAMASPSLCSAASFEGRLTAGTVSVGAAGKA